MIEVEHVIWDWNGTLVNDAPLSYEVLNGMLSRRGHVTITFEDYRRIYGHPVQGMYERAGFNLANEPFESLSHEWHAEYEDRLKYVHLQDDSLMALDRVKAAGISQTVLSALHHDILLESLGIHGIGDYFSYVHGLNDRLARSKIDNGRILMERIGVSADKTVLIGDSSHDVETANTLGTKCLLVSRGYEDEERLSKHGVAVFANFGELLGHLKF